MEKLVLKGIFCLAALTLFVACSSQKVQKVESEEVRHGEAAGFCSPEQGPPFSYRKKVAVLAAEVRDPQRDLPALDVAWSDVLQKRLADSGRLLVVDASKQHIHSGDMQREWIIDLASRLDVQFVIAVKFHSLHVSQRQIGGGIYTINLPGARRQIDAELVIFDGYSGAKIARTFHSANAKGLAKNIVNQAHQPVLRGAFFDSLLGEAMALVLASQVEEGLGKLACLPLMARVVNVSGHELRISTGGASFIRPGESLQLFRRYGMVESRLGPVDIVRVLPESIIAVYRGEGNAPVFSKGLFVRAW